MLGWPARYDMMLISLRSLVKMFGPSLWGQAQAWRGEKPNVKWGNEKHASKHDRLHR